jgi:uncharacterized protein
VKSDDTIAERKQQRLIRALREQAPFPHSVGSVEHLETHISHVLLAGNFAYKIKKPVNLGFLDFTSLPVRRHYAEEELRLNRRTAPALYLGVVPINGSEDHPTLGGSGPVIEYALKMRRFPQAALFSAMLECGEITEEHVDALAARIARFHGEIEAVDEASTIGAPSIIKHATLQNFEQFGPLLETQSDAHAFESLRAYTERAHARLIHVFRQRKRDGYVRECHGDLHLDNIAWYGGKVTLFDCIEFSEDLRWIDVMSEAAFVVMDLCARGHPGFAFRLLNAYLERTGDYGGLAVLRYYVVYRALVRAKVLALRAHDKGTATDAKKRSRSYLGVAHRFAGNGHAAIIIMHGVSGSGKSTFAQRLLEDLQAIRVRSDVERKRLFALEPQARSGSTLGRDLYAAQATRDTYAQLERLARVVAETGHPVIVDASFLKRVQRDRFKDLAEALKVPFVILACWASIEILRARVAERERRGRDPSEADVAVLEHQLTTHEPLQPDEQASAIALVAEQVDWHKTLRMLRVRLDQH